MPYRKFVWSILDSFRRSSDGLSYYISIFVHQKRPFSTILFILLLTIHNKLQAISCILSFGYQNIKIMIKSIFSIKIEKLKIKQVL